MNPLTIIEMKEFRSAIREWIAEHPEEFRRLLAEALSEIPCGTCETVTEEAKWAARRSREFWSRAGLEPPRSL
jgi:O6-methylguanine-DNA--protein-cysteine methyltransferase